MTRRDEAIRMARAAGFVLADNATDEAIGRFERFAALVAAAKQEQCAKVVEAPHWKPAVRHVLAERAAAIRALKDGEE